MTSSSSSVAKTDVILKRLLDLHPKVIDLSLVRIERLLDRLGRPQDKLPPVVHIAGTNGKGSVQAYMRAVFEASGYKVHAYTSPHLVHFSERIRLAGALISEDDLVALLEECEQVNDGAPITFFEITTAAAFLAFTRTPADVLLLEVGLGGRLDATNVVTAPAVTVITPISLDHQQYLGNTVAEIASEKAAIQKRGTTSIISAQLPEAMTAIEGEAQRLGVTLRRSGIEWSITHKQDEENRLYWRRFGRSLTLPLPGLPGAHQYGNAGTAVAALDLLDEQGIFTIPETAMAKGLTAVDWPARLQRLVKGPLVEAIPAEWALWLDGGHNPAAGEALGVWAASMAATIRQPLHLICGMLNTKDPRGFLAPLVGKAVSLHAVSIPGEANTFPAAATAAAGRDAGHQRVFEAESPATALTTIKAMEAGPAQILICGSLYLAGRVLVEND
ncbi:MAG: folylpolyglutamate synthase/dihydrofolate synthase family protein [Alphaproteobacteria bacterium]